MDRDAERNNLIRNLFDHAIKIQISKLARKYDPDLVFKVWMQMAKIKGRLRSINGYGNGI